MANLATIPDLWSRLALLRLIQNSVGLSTVNRQYSAELAEAGQTVKAHRPQNRKVRRKAGTDTYTRTDTATDSVDVKLDQVFYDSTTIYAHEQSLSMVDLVALHLNPMVDSITQGVDRLILGQVHRFIHQGSPAKRSGKLGGMTADNCYGFLLEANEVLNKANVPGGQKTLCVDPATRTILKLNKLFVAADQRGDGGAALGSSRIGIIDDFNIVMGQNVNNVPTTAVSETQDVESASLAAGYASTIATDDFSRTLAVGEFLVIRSNGQPTYIATTDGVDAVTLNEPLKYAVVADDKVDSYAAVTNEAVERVAGYQKEMLFTHASGKNLVKGQLIAFGTSSRHTYTIIEATVASATTTSVLLDRPLDATVASGAAAYPGPAGSINPVWHPDALAFVSRPMHSFGNQFGVLSSVFAADGIGINITMQHNSDKGGLDINMTLLAGIAELNSEMGVALLA